MASRMIRYEPSLRSHQKTASGRPWNAGAVSIRS